jgi:hypothetical protein
MVHHTNCWQQAPYLQVQGGTAQAVFPSAPVRPAPVPVQSPPASAGNRPPLSPQVGQVHYLPCSPGNSPIRQRRKIVHEAVTSKDKRGAYAVFVNAERLRLSSVLPGLTGTIMHPSSHQRLEVLTLPQT